MSDEKKYTERDVVLRERAAWLACDTEMATNADEKMLKESADEAAKRYPLPKVPRPRVVVDNGTRFRVVEGCIEAQYSDSDEKWYPVTVGLDATSAANRVRILADLLARPTEEVEAEL